jgi:hypothetical protein
LSESKLNNPGNSIVEPRVDLPYDPQVPSPYKLGEDTERKPVKYVQYIPKNKYGSVDEAILALKLQQLQAYIDKESVKDQEVGKKMQQRVADGLQKRETQRCRSMHAHFRRCPNTKDIDVAQL